MKAHEITETCRECTKCSHTKDIDEFVVWCGPSPWDVEVDGECESCRNDQPEDPMGPADEEGCPRRWP